MFIPHGRFQKTFKYIMFKSLTAVVKSDNAKKANERWSKRVWASVIFQVVQVEKVQHLVTCQVIHISWLSWGDIISLCHNESGIISLQLWKIQFLRGQISPLPRTKRSKLGNPDPGSVRGLYLIVIIKNAVNIWRFRAHTLCARVWNKRRFMSIWVRWSWSASKKMLA